MKAGVAGALVCVAALVAGMAGAAENYPSRPIRVVNLFPPGGSTEVILRPVGQKFSERTGQNLVVDARPGAGTNLGTEIAARATPDGYTLLHATSSLAINASLYRKLPFDAIRDFEPIVHWAEAPNVLVVHPGLPVKTARELVELARAKPGSLSYGSSGSGATNHLGMELLRSVAKIDLVHVPYKGGGPAQTALMSNEVQVLFNPPSSVLPFVKAGRMKALGVASRKRIDIAPDMPTIDESGVPGFESGVWYGMFAPAKTPRAIVTRLNSEFNTIMRMPEVRERLAAVGIAATGGTPEELGAYLKAETEKWGRVVKASGARVE
jgi:tripartite-type tricarboxylate transporter receptor subunit TctC